jgi:hypothetical protein
MRQSNVVRFFQSLSRRFAPDNNSLEHKAQISARLLLSSIFSGAQLAPITCTGEFVDYFEGLIKTLLEHEGYWVRQSFKVNLTREEKRDIGKPSIPRPEIDILAFKPGENQVIAFEAKSYLDSPGVKLNELVQSHKIPEGRYKLFTCDNYREIVFSRMKQDLIDLGMGTNDTEITLGLAAGNVYQSKSEEIRKFLNSKGWSFLSPEDIREKVTGLAEKGYENEPSIITTKILMR